MKTAEDILRKWGDAGEKLVTWTQVTEDFIRDIQADARAEPLAVLRECRNLMAGCYFGSERTQRLRDGIAALLAGAPEPVEPTDSRRKRHARAIALLDEWVADDSDYDETTWLRLEAALRGESEPTEPTHMRNTEAIELLGKLLCLVGTCLKWDSAPDVPYEAGQEAKLRTAYCETVARAEGLLKERIARASEPTEPTTPNPDLDYNERRTAAWVSWEFETPGWDSRCADFYAGFDCGHADEPTAEAVAEAVRAECERRVLREPTFTDKVRDRQAIYCEKIRSTDIDRIIAALRAGSTGGQS
jgi:hypothetical protein